jgi:hypothetical protein
METAAMAAVLTAAVLTVALAAEATRVIEQAPFVRKERI